MRVLLCVECLGCIPHFDAVTEGCKSLRCGPNGMESRQLQQRTATRESMHACTCACFVLFSDASPPPPPSPSVILKVNNDSVHIFRSSLFLNICSCLSLSIIAVYIRPRHCIFSAFADTIKSVNIISFVNCDVSEIEKYKHTFSSNFSCFLKICIFFVTLIVTVFFLLFR